MPTVTVISPRAPKFIASKGVTPLATLKGKTLGLLHNSKPNASLLLERVARGVVEKTGITDVVRASKALPSSAAPDDVYKLLAERCGAVIFASAD